MINCKVDLSLIWSEKCVLNNVQSNITMPMYNLIEYSHNYSDTSGNLWQFKRDEVIGNHLLSTNQILLVILLQMGQTEKKKA